MAEQGEKLPWSPERTSDELAMLARLHLGPHLRSRVDAVDLVQETLLKAHLKKDQLRGQTEQERLGWLRQILVRTTIDRVRHLRASGGQELALADLQRSMEESSERLQKWVVDQAAAPGESLQQKELLLALARALTRLPENQRLAVELKYLQDPGWKLADIGQHLGCTAKAVAGLLERGLKRLRQLLSNKS